MRLYGCMYIGFRWMGWGLLMALGQPVKRLSKILIAM